MHAILWDRVQGEVSAASDPRGEGAALVWKPLMVGASVK